MEDKAKFAEALSRYYAGQQGQGLVVVFDNVDKLSTDRQLAIFKFVTVVQRISRSRW